MLNRICLRAKRPLNPAYPAKLDTLGDHLRKTRIDRGLSQPEVARILHVTPDTVTGWELNRHQPPARLAKTIITFLGFCPYQAKSLGKQLYYARLITGKTQKEVAKEIGCDASNLRYIELDQRVPKSKTLKKIQAFIDLALVDFAESNHEINANQL